MEKVYTEKQTKEANRSLVTAGFYLEVSCCMCGTEAAFTGATEDEVLEAMVNAEWLDLDSDTYQVTGNYCGCDYLD